LKEQEWGKGVFRKRGDVVSRDIAGETILVPIRGKLADMQRIFSLTPVASYIWGRLDGEKSLEMILQDVMDNFDVGHTEAEKDLREFMEELFKAGLLESVR
jgi:hypothetical protein